MILPYLQTNKLTCDSFWMLVEREHPGSDTKDVVSHSISHSQGVSILSVPLGPRLVGEQLAEELSFVMSEERRQLWRVSQCQVNILATESYLLQTPCPGLVAWPAKGPWSTVLPYAWEADLGMPGPQQQ